MYISIKYLYRDNLEFILYYIIFSSTKIPFEG